MTDTPEPSNRPEMRHRRIGHRTRQLPTTSRVLYRIEHYSSLSGVAIAVLLVVVCLLTVITVIAAAFYNLFSELLGGIEVTVVEQEELSE